MVFAEIEMKVAARIAVSRLAYGIGILVGTPGMAGEWASMRSRLEKAKR